MSYTIQLTDEQYEAFKRGESITLIPPQTVKSLTYKKDVNSSLVICFTDLQEGTVVIPNEHYNAGTYKDTWYEFNNTTKWEDVFVHNGLVHKQLVWCWDNKSTHVKLLRFYDAMNKCTYSHKGHQGGFTFDNYEPYIGPWPEWATQALNTLA